ncbi:MAG: DUF503 domain-containing protein [Enterocloster asparagiformis]|nr:DUF503 domain-containing protein [Enterocloster asparagiformis]
MMIIGMEIRLYAPWVHSLKEKRMIVKSLTAKIQNRFHVSAAEVEAQDVHQTIVIGVASIVPHRAQADRFAQEVQRFVEESTEAQVMDVQTELYS